jgi:hypothetical protein
MDLKNNAKQTNPASTRSSVSIFFVLNILLMVDQFKFQVNRVQQEQGNEPGRYDHDAVY